jgi:hypothetical protein
MTRARHRTTRASLAGLTIVGVAMGWFEAAVVIDLRQIYYPDGFRFPLVVMSDQLLAVELVREAASLILLGGIAWLASQHRAGRLGAFLLLFGVWDLVYYAGLQLVLGWPSSLTTPDLLFLIPAPWIGPVWAPASVAALFTVIGWYLFRTRGRPRRYRPRDVAVLVLSAAAVVVSFLADWTTMTSADAPDAFRPWLFLIGAAAGTAWFVRTERRQGRGRHVEDVEEPGEDALA